MWGSHNSVKRIKGQDNNLCASHTLLSHSSSSSEEVLPYSNIPCLSKWPIQWETGNYFAIMPSSALTKILDILRVFIKTYNNVKGMETIHDGTDTNQLCGETSSFYKM